MPLTPSLEPPNTSSLSSSPTLPHPPLSELSGILAGLRRLLLAGLTTGTLLGAAAGAAFVAANRYLTGGFPGLALDAFQNALNQYASGTAILFLDIGFTYLVLHALDRFLGRAPAALRPVIACATLWLAAATGAALWLLAGAAWTPRVRSLRGLLFFGAVAFAGFTAVRLARRHPERLSAGVRTALAGLGRARFAGAALLLLAAANAIPAAARLGAGGASKPPINILLITIDTLRADHLGAYGYTRDTSPNIDRLARGGVLFQRAVAQWPKTSPSFASMLSSTYGHTNGLIRTHGQRMPDRFFLLAELLKAGGYTTWATVANVNLAKTFNFDQGFDTYEEVWKEGGDERLRSQLVTRRGLDLLRRASRERPFFLWLHYLDPHARYQPIEPYDEMFVDDAYFDPAWRVPLLDKPRRDIGGIPTRATLGGEDRIGYYTAQYDAEIRSVDEQVGIVLKTLEEQGLAAETLVILTADHGESLGDHNYFFDHGRFPYDDCVRVPLIVRGPGAGESGRIVRSPVGLIDLAPTLLDLAGLPSAAEAEGESLRPLLEGDREDGARRIYAFTESGYSQDYQRSITTERYKLVYVPDPGDQQVMQGRELELYDLHEDPGETKNLIDEQPEVARLLWARLARWMEAGGTTARAPRTVRLDRKTEEQLRSLGYIE